jgi:putative spermidine/putrescine transport system substrate-binding protein
MRIRAAGVLLTAAAALSLAAGGTALAQDASPSAPAASMAAPAATPCAAQSSTATSSGDWTTPPDCAAAAAEAATFVTLGAPNDWANYGEQFTTFCQTYFGFDCNRTERSQGEDLSSAEEIQQFDAQKNNPQAVLADIGILFANQAEQVGVLPNYLPDNASLLDPTLKGANGGWTATFVGVPGFVVNTDYLASKGVAVPMTWADLIKPEYAGMVGFGKPGSSGTATEAFVAMNLAAGGTLDDYTKGIEYAKALLPNIAASEGNADSFEKGEVPIQIKYDFNLIALANAENAKGVHAQVVIPSDGSIYAPSAIIANQYDVAHKDFAQMFMNWILSDEGQTIFAKFGARPIRSVTGDNPLVVPDDAKTLWLPDDQYANVTNIDQSKIDITNIADIWQNQVGAGG